MDEYNKTIDRKMERFAYCTVDFLDTRGSLCRAGDLAAYAVRVDKMTFLEDNSLFSMEDWSADLDVWNIYELVQNTGTKYSMVMKEYFSTITEKDRVMQFQQKKIRR